MKIAPIIEALARRDDVETYLVHTGQHYDQKMSQLFFEELGIPTPDINLEVGGGSHAAQTAQIMTRFETVCLEQQPDWVLVVGDVNSTLACTLVAAKLHIPVAHVEAGLRSFDRHMPEEINRVVTDRLADLLFVTEPSGVENLQHEGVSEKRIHFVGNVMIDTLLRFRDRAESSKILDSLSLTVKSYALVTLHRPSNVDDRQVLDGILNALEQISKDQPVIFPIHPRSRKNLERMGFEDRVLNMSDLKLIEPLGYLDFLKLMAHAAIVLTDSGGIQEETTILNVPCLTLRENTERPVTISDGTNRLVGVAAGSILQAYKAMMDNPPSVQRPPALWDGKAAERIASILVNTQCVESVQTLSLSTVGAT